MSEEGTECTENLDSFCSIFRLQYRTKTVCQSRRDFYKLREDGELEDGEIDDGIGIKEDKEAKSKSENVEVEREEEKLSERDDKSLHSHKRNRKPKAKQRSKRRQLERCKSSGPCSDSFNSPHDHQDSVKNKRRKHSYKDYDGEFTKDSSEYYGNPTTLAKCKNSGSVEDYGQEQNDFNEELFKYNQSKESTTSSHGKAGLEEQMTWSCTTGQQFRDKCGRGHGQGVMSTGIGALNKNVKSVIWRQGRGRRAQPKGGRGSKQEARSQKCFQKKRPIMSQEFISQHSVEHNGRYICKYFIAGRCIKEDQCKFEHDNVDLGKKKELCKFYVQGYCTKGANCIFMHNEFPCKFFHTGTKCYQGDNCKFSHDPLTEVTTKLLEKVLNTDEEHTKENKQELNELNMEGTPLLNSPPDAGLLPTPGPGSLQDSSMKIPSLFEINSWPTVDSAHKIALKPNFYNSTTSPLKQFQRSENSSRLPSALEDMQTGSMMSPGNSHSLLSLPGKMGGPPYHFPVPPQSPPNLLPRQGFGQGIPMPSAVLLNQPSVLHQNNNPLMNQQGAASQSVPAVQVNTPLQAMDQMPSEIFKNLFNVKILDLSEKATKWHSNGDEDGNSVRTVLKTLKNQDEILKTQQSEDKLQQLGMTSTPLADLRFHKESFPFTDPWGKVNTQPHITDARESYKRKPGNPLKADPLFNLHPHSSVTLKPSVYEEDEEVMLREQTALIPLDPHPGAMLRDPRCQLKKIRHIRVDVLHQRPAFADSVVWAPEDLIPLLIPKQELSINLPLPPLIADAQLNRSRASSSDHPLSSGFPPPAARIREDAVDPCIPAGKTLKPQLSSVKPTDPRTQKVLNPRISRSGSLDSVLPAKREGLSSGGVADPRLQRSAVCPTATTAKPNSEQMTPKVFCRASSTAVGIKKPTTLLGGISLYDPRNYTLLSPNQETDEPLKKRLKQSMECKSLNRRAPLPPQVTSDEKRDDTDSESQTNGFPSGQSMSTSVPDSCISLGKMAAPAIHNLPIQPLAALIRPAYTDSRQNKQSGQAAEAQQKEEAENKEMEKKKRPLRDVFKTFDPTVSPFC